MEIDSYVAAKYVAEYKQMFIISTYTFNVYNRSKIDRITYIYMYIIVCVYIHILLYVTQVYMHMQVYVSFCSTGHLYFRVRMALIKDTGSLTFSGSLSTSRPGQLSLIAYIYIHVHYIYVHHILHISTTCTSLAYICFGM